MTENALAAIELTDKAIGEIKTVDDACEFIKKLDTLKKLLKAADMYEQKAKQYARLEVAALVRIVELGLYKQAFAKSKQSKRYRALEWIAEMDGEKRSQIVNECSERGLLLETIYHERVEKKGAIDYMRNCGGRAIKEFRKNGEVDLNRYLDEGMHKGVPDGVYKGFKDVVRHKIRQFGGHGVGDGSGTYVAIEKAKGYADRVLENKVKSIHRDLMRLMETTLELYRIGDGKLPKLAIRRKFDFTYELTDDSLVNLMVCFMGYAEPIFCDSDESTAKAFAYLLDKVGWPAKKIVSVIESEYEENPYTTSRSAVQMLGCEKIA